MRRRLRFSAALYFSCQPGRNRLEFAYSTRPDAFCGLFLSLTIPTDREYTSVPADLNGLVVSQFGGAMNIKKLFLTMICLTAVGACVELGAQTRIKFAKGRSSATVSGTIGSNLRRSYVLGAREGQTLSANVSSKNDCVKFTEGSTNVNLSMTTGNNRLSLTNFCSHSTVFTMTVSINDDGVD